uniref:Uncharacterized protein n=1 Tax=Amphimedon queenslandica TaxID=400682 RepID=A0A1X7SSU2_AMPQE
MPGSEPRDLTTGEVVACVVTVGLYYLYLKAKGDV